MDEHSKKKIAPMIVTIIMLIYYAVYFGVMITFLPLFWKMIVGVVPLLLAATTIYVCIQRFKEIDGGEEDDLSKY